MKPSKEEQKKLIIELMEMDEKAGLYYKTPSIPDYPFSITFSYKNKSVKIELVNGEDIMKLADIFSSFLTENGIKNKKIVIGEDKKI